MRERDHLSLFDYDLACEIIPLEREDLWRFIAPRIDALRALPTRMSCFILPPTSTRPIRAAFDDFFDEDPADVKQPLINDLCYHGPRLAMSYVTRAGYLDHPTSALVHIGSADRVNDTTVISSPRFLPWAPDSDSWYWAGRFDLLTAEHVSLMIESLRANRDSYEPAPQPYKQNDKRPPSATDYTAELLFLTTMHSKLVADTTLRAAYIYAARS